MTRKKKEVKEEELVEEFEELAEEPQKTYMVLHDFKDLQDKNKIYIKGDTYPKPSGTIVSDARIKELSSTKNKIGKRLIKEQA